MPEEVSSMPPQPGPPPWIAVIILPAGLMATAAGDLEWIADFERCLAWALIEEHS